MKIFLFETVHKMMHGERILKNNNLSYEILPTPKQFSKECGMCIGVVNEDKEKAKDFLNDIYIKIVEILNK